MQIDGSGSIHSTRSNAVLASRSSPIWSPLSIGLTTSRSRPRAGKVVFHRATSARRPSGGEHAEDFRALSRYELRLPPAMAALRAGRFGSSVGTPTIQGQKAKVNYVRGSCSVRKFGRKSTDRVPGPIWRRPDGSLQPARGQARIPSLADAELLIRLARELGWGDRHADDALGQVQ